MKTYRWIFVPVTILAGIVIWMLQTQRQAGKSPSHANAGKAARTHLRDEQPKILPVEEIIERQRLADKQRLSREAVQLVENVRKAVRIGDMMEFDRGMSEILYQYKGDPNLLIRELSDLLDHENIFVRMRMVGVSMLTSIETKKATKMLSETILSDVPIIYKGEEMNGINEFPLGDMRIDAANTIALYGIKDASDDIWKLYQKTQSKELVSPLRRLNDPRIIEKLRADAVKNPGSIENMKLIGEYRFAEALPELKKRYEDKKSNSDVRFRTLFPLWRITGEEKYFDEFAASFLPASIPLPYLAIGGEREHQYLSEMMKTATADQLYGAAMALYVRFNDHETIKKTLIAYYGDVRGSNWGDPVLARRLVGSIDDPELTRVAEEYETKYPTGNFDRDTVYRKKWSYAKLAEVLFMD